MLECLACCRMSPRLLVLAAAVAAACACVGLVSAGPPGAARRADERTVELVVRLRAKPVARGGRSAAVDRAQRRFGAALRSRIPDARIRWRYRLVLDGVAVVLPVRAAAALRELPGVAEVYPTATYTAAAGPAVEQIGALQLWGSGLESAGDGIKIGIIDDGLDQTHAFFDPTGFTMPAGFPKGNTAYTTAKVIAARVFSAPGQTKHDDLVPFDPDESHGTHVAGIAAGDAGTRANGAIVSGVAPRAYIGNYRALTVPTDGGFGDDGNAPELVAAIEAAVADGMDVINISVGEPEIEPSRDVVALALDGAAAAGVVPVVSAGNDFDEFGAGSVSSPASSASAIAVAAVSATRGSKPGGVVGYFSSEGPTPISLRLKPEVAAPGVDILSSFPSGWGTLSGTSMAAPHVSGGAALLRERHPDWNVAQIKAALVETGHDVWLDAAHRHAAAPIRAGGGLVDLPQADQPLVFTSPSTVSWGLVRAGTSATTDVTVTDAGGGAGTWGVSVDPFGRARARVSAPATVDVPGTLPLTVAAAADAREGEAQGYVVLTRDGVSRRIPYWARVTRRLLAQEPAATLRAPGVYSGDTRGRRRLVSTYRYPSEAGHGTEVALRGPEQVFRVVLRHPVQNVGVVVLSRAPGVAVQPRMVAGADENRLTGYAALPLVINPYLAGYGDAVLAAGAIRPAPGTYAVVFDSRTVAGAGRYSFRFWVNDVTPPAARLVSGRVTAGSPLRIRVADRGSGVDPETAVATIDGKSRRIERSGNELLVDTRDLAPGLHHLRFQVSDYQETRNMENVAAVLPNTRRFSTTVRIR